MRYLSLLFLFLAACHFHPLYTNTQRQDVCVKPIPNESGYHMYQKLQQYFPQKENCLYTLTVNAPKYSYSDQSISDKDFITMQHIAAETTYTLQNAQNEIVLKNTAYTSGSSAVTSSPYASVMGTEKTSKDLGNVLTEQIMLHVCAFLDEDNK